MRSSTLEECIALAIESAFTDPVEALLSIYRAIDAGCRPGEIRDRLRTRRTIRGQRGRETKRAV